MTRPPTDRAHRRRTRTRRVSRRRLAAARVIALICAGISFAVASGAVALPGSALGQQGRPDPAGDSRASGTGQLGIDPDDATSGASGTGQLGQPDDGSSSRPEPAPDVDDSTGRPPPAPDDGGDSSTGGDATTLDPDKACPGGGLTANPLDMIGPAVCKAVYKLITPDCKVSTLGKLPKPGERQPEPDSVSDPCAVGKHSDGPGTKFLQSLTSTPDYAQKGTSVSDVGRGTSAIGLGLLAATMTFAIIQFWLTGIVNFEGELVAARGLVRGVGAGILIAMWPWIFDQALAISNALSAAVLETGVQSKLANVGMLLLSAGAATPATQAVALIVVIILVLVGLIVMLALLVMKMAMAASLALIFLGMPILIALWPVPLLSFLAKLATKIMIVILLVPTVWALIFVLFTALSLDTLTFGQGTFDGVGIWGTLLRPLEVIVLGYLLYKMPLLLAKVAGMSAAASTLSGGGGGAGGGRGGGGGMIKGTGRNMLSNAVKQHIPTWAGGDKIPDIQVQAEKGLSEARANEKDLGFWAKEAENAGRKAKDIADRPHEAGEVGRANAHLAEHRRQMDEMRANEADWDRRLDEMWDQPDTGSSDDDDLWGDDFQDMPNSAPASFEDRPDGWRHGHGGTIEREEFRHGHGGTIEDGGTWDPGEFRHGHGGTIDPGTHGAETTGRQSAGVTDDDYDDWRQHGGDGGGSATPPPPYDREAT